MKSSYTWKLLTLALLFVATPVMAQDEEEEYEGDPEYREDQFYIGASYNFAIDVPPGVSINGFSGGVQLGFLRDMPFNERRNLAAAIGLGLTYDQFGQNLAITEDVTGATNFTVLTSDVDFTSNRYSIAMIEAPFELRWRTSTASSYKFWRVYAGVRVGYVYYFKAKLRQSGNNISLTDLPELDRLQMGLSLSVGYNTVNFYGYYGLTPLFSNASTDTGANVGFNSVKLGLIFYIL